MNVTPRILLPFFLALNVLSLPACALSGGAIEGQVLEEGANKPVAQAIVVVKWVGSVSKFVDSQGVCVHVETAITDHEGRYHTPSWSASSTVGPEILVSRLIPVFTAYKPGYKQVEKETDFPLYLKPFTGERGERLEYLKRTSRVTGCHSAGESEKNLLPLRNALYQEALQLVQTKDDQKVLEDLLYSKEIAEFGYDAAQKRHLERLGAQK